ncbi:MAG: hypothetical protein WCB18_08390 [Thermoplasmata archaeon]
MSDSAALPAAFVHQVQDRVLNIYAAVLILMLATIGLLVVYCIQLGPLVGPGVEQSFGLAVALLFLCAAMIAHIVDRTYRVWPEGRSVHPTFPGFFTDRGVANFVKILVIVGAGATIAYVIATLITS